MKYTVFINQKTQSLKDIFPNRVKDNPIKFEQVFILVKFKMILKFMWKCKGPRKYYIKRTKRERVWETKI